jgi:hypothetical protein
MGSNAIYGGAGTAQITKPSTPQFVTLNITTSEDDERGGVLIVTTGGDQVLVTANVDSVIVFIITDPTIGFGPLSASGARWAIRDTLGSGSAVSAHDITAFTNTTSGYTVYVFGSTLISGADTINAIDSLAAASGLGAKQFGIKVSASGGSGAAVSPYTSANYANNATTTQDDIANSGVPFLTTTTTTYSITYLDNISEVTQPGSYSITLTYTAPGLF